MLFSRTAKFVLSLLTTLFFCFVNVSTVLGADSNITYSAAISNPISFGENSLKHVAQIPENYEKISSQESIKDIISPKEVPLETELPKNPPDLKKKDVWNNPEEFNENDLILETVTEKTYSGKNKLWTLWTHRLKLRKTRGRFLWKTRGRFLCLNRK